MKTALCVQICGCELTVREAVGHNCVKHLKRLTENIKREDEAVIVTLTSANQVLNGL